MRSRVWMVIDSLMLLIVVSLQAWRLTGVVLHEWLAVALIAGILSHLLLHWPWVESRSKRILLPRTGRARVNYALNLTLFLSMSATMVSGFMISKVVLPVHITAMEFLKWHGIHDTSSRIALICAGLHLGLNWDLMRIAIRNFFRRPGVMKASPVRLSPAPAIGLESPARIDIGRTLPSDASRRSGFTASLIARAITTIIVAVILAGSALWAIERTLPAKDVTIIGPDGKRFEHATPPPDIARLRPDEVFPSSRGLPPAILQGVIVALAAVAGRKVLRLRLE